MRNFKLAEARAVHGEGLLDDARGRFGQMILGKLVFPRQRHVDDVASRAQLAAGSFAEIIHNHVVVFGALPLASVPGIGGKNPLEDLDHLEHAHRQAGLFSKLARAALHKRFPQLERASRNRPLAAQRFAAAADQQRAAVLDHDAADADYRTLRKFPRRWHSDSPARPRTTPRLRSLLPRSAQELTSRAVYNTPYGAGPDFLQSAGLTPGGGSRDSLSRMRCRNRRRRRRSGRRRDSQLSRV